MNSLFWSLSTLNGFDTVAPILKVAFLVFALFCWDFPLVLVYRLWLKTIGRSREERDEDAKPLPVLVVIPSLLRQRDELTSMMSTVGNVMNNGYPGDVTIVVTIDGTGDAPPLYAELTAWAAAERWPSGHRLFVTGTQIRRSKPMAIHHAVHFVKELVATKVLPSFPPVYVSTDADADLGPRALERIVYRLQRRNRITGWPARVVAGALHVRGNRFWRGWRNFFSVEGQLNLQVAREYYVGNIWRYNIRWLPITGVPGAFYCTWSELFISIPKYMGYLQTLKRSDWYRWWLGYEPPRFSESTAEEVPELMAGDTDDTVTAFAATFARFENGKLTLNSPKTPVHAFVYMLRALLIDRALQFEPEARVFTSSPTTVRGLFKQRKRWNCSRVELTGRFWRSLGYNWSLALPAFIVKFYIARSLIVGALVYLFLPLFYLKTMLLTGILIGYVCNLLVWWLMTMGALSINNELRHWRLMLALPFAPIYQIIFNWAPAAIGVTSDVLLFGNVTGFTPEHTLKQGGSVRVALLYRIRRFFALLIRSAVHGDVPFGRFWFGWGETPWTESGFEGWTTGKRPAVVTAALKKR